MAPEDTTDIEFKFIESEELAKVDYIVDQQYEQLKRIIKFGENYMIDK